ncbi:hypothetical protein Vadar_014430 [Vaccinium darrowii]|uniref:Uncharacterized protein n=1 Tax=Vaccinium darrowii TaxID=229202 RepID=A0ACB7YVT9_9ERIC|nr:hypothetical protein Vadar_014430 [Vaccinium darrowii]
MKVTPLLNPPLPHPEWTGARSVTSTALVRPPWSCSTTNSTASPSARKRKPSDWIEDWMADKGKKEGKQPTTSRQELALTTSSIAIPPIELVNRFQILNPTPVNQYEEEDIDIPSVHEEPEGVKNLMNVVFKHARMEGFVVFNYYLFYSKFLELPSKKPKKGKKR